MAEASGSCGSLCPALDITFCSLLVVGVDLVAPAEITAALWLYRQ